MTRHWSEARRKEMAGAKAQKIVTPRLFVRAAPVGEIKLVEANIGKHGGGRSWILKQTSSFVTSRTAVTPVDGSREQFIGNQTVYRRRQADLQPLRWNSTRQRAENLRHPKRRQRDDRWRRSRTRQCCRHCPGELTIKSVEANMEKTAVGFV